MLHLGDGCPIDQPCRNGGAGNKVGSASCRQYGKSNGGKRTVEPSAQTGRPPGLRGKPGRTIA